MFEHVDPAAGHLELDGQQAGLFSFWASSISSRTPVERQQRHVHLAGSGGVPVADDLAFDLLEQVGT